MTRHQESQTGNIVNGLRSRSFGSEGCFTFGKKQPDNARPDAIHCAGLANPALAPALNRFLRFNPNSGGRRDR